jgi:hypothetical protein
MPGEVARRHPLLPSHPAASLALAVSCRFLSFLLDLARVQVHTDAAADGGSRHRGTVELHTHHTSVTMRAGYTAPQRAGGAAAGRRLAPADTALDLLAVVDVADALADVPLGILAGVHVLDADEGGLLRLTVQAAGVACQRALHVQARRLAVAVHLARLGGQLVQLLAALGVDLRRRHSVQILY